METPKSPSDSWWRRDYLFVLLLILAVMFIYQPVWQAGFIWDDDAHLTDNPCIVGPLGFAGIWTSSAAVYYPLVLTSFWLQHQLWGLNPLPYHLINILLHAACAITLWRVLLALGIRGARWGTLLWALHPVMVQSVAWVTEMKNTQSGLFYLLAILWFVQNRAWEIEPKEAIRWRRLGWPLFFFLLAITSKSSTVMLPAVLALCAWWMQGKWQWRNLVLLLPFFLLSALASGWTIWEQKFHSGALGPEWVHPWPERLVIAGRDLWFYLGKLLWPQPLIFIYPRWQINAGNPLSWLPLLAAAAGLCLLWLKRQGRARPFFFVAAYFVIALSPVLNFFSVYFFRYSFVSDHFQYLASMGPLALAGAAIATAGARLSQKRQWLPQAAAITLLLVFSALTFRQSATYHTAETLYRSTIAKNPRCWLALNNLGNLLFEREQIDDALSQYRATLKVKPDHAEAHNNIGRVLSRKGRTDEAMNSFAAALRYRPQFPEASTGLGNAYLQKGEPEKAEACYRSALDTDASYAEAHFGLGTVFLQRGEWDGAISQFQAALKTGPNAPEAQSGLGQAFLQKMDFDQAISYFRKAIALNPRDIKAHYGLANALFGERKFSEAMIHYRAVLEIEPGAAEAQNNLGNALLQQGQVAEAEGHFRAALTAKPDYPEAHNNLAAVLLQAGQQREAALQYESVVKLKPDFPEAARTLAWILATSREEALRNGPRALELAQLANQQKNSRDPFALATLAAAFAENGRFPEALEAAGEALNLATARGNADLATTLRNHLALYQEDKPIR